MKFRYKLMFGMWITLCLSFGIGGMLLMYYSFCYSLDTAASNCMEDYQNVQNTIKIAGQTSDGNYDEVFQSVLSQLSHKKSTPWKYIRLTDLQSGELIYSNDAKNLEKEREGNFENDSVSTYSFQEGEHYYYQITGNISIYLADGETVIKALSVCMVYEITPVYEFRSSELRIYRKVMLVLFLFGALLSYLFSRQLTKPVEQLSKVVRRIAKGEIKSRAYISSGDEIELLSNDINSMAETIEEDMEKLKESVEKQELFMASFAHEMKTPMTSIIGYADLMRSHELENEEIKECSNYIFRESRRLENLAFKMLELVVTNKEELTLMPNDPAEVLRDVFRRIESISREKDILLTFDCERGRVLLDKDLFSSMMGNLMDNAIKSIDGEGEIKVMGRSKEGNYVIVVKDNGRGISKEDLEKITEPFYRVDKSRSRLQGGAGLGLAICQRIAEIHNTKLEYKSKIGEGTEVRICMRETKEAGNEK